MAKVDEQTGESISRQIEAEVDALVREHVAVGTQEDKLTSRIAERIEAVLLRILPGAWKVQVRVIVHEMSSAGEDSDEKKSGADLYIGVVIEDRTSRTSKGALVQAKNADGPKGAKLDEQCTNMRNETEDAAYVWMYGPDGTTVIDAAEVLHRRPRQHFDTLPSMTIGDLFEGFFTCTEGDQDIGMLDHPNRTLRQQLFAAMKRYQANGGLAIALTSSEK